MTTVLFCWELGANFGHLSAIAALRGELTAAGFDVSYAVADLSAASEMLGASARLLQAPVWPRHVHAGSPIGAASFADVLTLTGFGKSERLGVMVDAWRRLFDLAGAEVILADHSPAAQLAARIAGLKLITIGTGFTSPPLGYDQFPLLRADVAPAVPEKTLWTSAETVARARGLRPIPSTLPGFFEADARIVIGLPELDPYQPFRQEQLWAPPGGFPAPGEAGPTHVFAYLGAELPGIETRLQVLCDLPHPVEVHLRGADPFLLEFVRLRGKVVHDGPADMAAVLARATHVVSQGGAMTASMAMAAGRPHLMLPLHAETQINAGLAARLGVAMNAQSPRDAKSFGPDLIHFLADRGLEERARNTARVLATRPLPDAGAGIMAALRQVSA